MPASEYADWKAPKGDTDILLWPSRTSLLSQVEQNGRQLSAAGTPILGVPLNEVRAATRRYLGHDGSAPLILTGHQTELHHPGVWIKNAVIHHLAEQLNGHASTVSGARAMHLAVDTDQPKHLLLRYPKPTGSESLPITDDEAFTSADWSGRLSAPSPAHATALERQFRTDAAAFGFEPALLTVLASLRRAALEENVLPPVLVGALHELDWSLGLRYDAILASPLWDSEYFLLFAAHLIAQAGRYASAYDAALAEYRKEEGIDNPGRPMPDLKVVQSGADHLGVELPLWLDDLALGTRFRPYASIRGGQAVLEVQGEKFAVNASGGWDTARDLQRFLRRHNHRLSPRALTLTTFSRLLICDLFVHGIGGGRYDQVTDKTLRTFFGLTNIPSFAVATGTLYFPWAVGRSKTCIPCIKQEGHHLAHNLPSIQKQSYLNAIAASPRRSSARKQAYLELHQQIAIARRSSPELTQWQTRLERSIQEAVQDKVIFDRELFYALQPRDRLQSWISQVGELLAR